jgi:hypothetical protein
MWLDVSKRRAHTRRSLDVDHRTLRLEVLAFVKDFSPNWGLTANGAGVSMQRPRRLSSVARATTVALGEPSGAILAVASNKYLNFDGLYPRVQGWGIFDRRNEEFSSGFDKIKVGFI